MTRRKTDPTDIAIARDLIRMGVPVFVAERSADFPYGGTGDTGYHLPSGWQETKPDEVILDDWRPGDAVAAVMGHVFDVLDTDPRHGGDDSFDELAHELAGDLPVAYGEVTTPSGGWHHWIAALGIGKHTDWWKAAGWPGLDLQGGRPDGTSLGFVFIPPTERRSKVDGEVYPYTWDDPPVAPDADDASGEYLARLIIDSVGAKSGTASKKGAAGDGTGRMLTYAEIRRYLKNGIPREEAQDVTLARCVWAWRMRRATKKWAHDRWQQVVDKTELTDPGRPFTRADFNRHWKGADEKRSAEEADERAGRRVRRDVEDDEDEIGTLVFTKASDVKMRAVEWVWQDRLPRGTFCLSAGAGGAGKSLHAVWMAAELTKGTLPGCFFGAPKQVIWATLEASPEVEVAPRLAASGANMQMVEFVTVQMSSDHADDHIRIFDPAYIEQLRDRVRRGNVGMVVLDPALDALSGKVNNKEQAEVRAAIARIHALAESTGILVHGIAHFNKMTTVDDAMMRITGSAAWGQRVRAALVFAFDEEEKVFVLSQGKNNWGQLDLPSLAFIVEKENVRMADGKRAEAIRLSWTEDSEADVNSLLARKRSGKPSKLAEAEDFLFNMLNGKGPVEKSLILAAAKEEKIAETTLEKAARSMGVRSAEMPMSPGKRGRPPATWDLPNGF